MQVLKRRLARQDYTEDLFERELSKNALSGPDRGLCQELVYGIARWQATLDWLIQRKTQGRTQKEELRILLQLGLYQMFWLDRIPDHAAVHETVEIAKRLGFGPQSGFVNAILRGYAREREETKQLLADLKAKEPPLGYSHPAWLWERWSKRWGAEKTAALMNWNNTPPLIYARVNFLKTDAAKLAAVWDKEGIRFRPLSVPTQHATHNIPDWCDPNTVFQLESHPPLSTLRSFQDGLFYIQDPSTLLAVEILGPQPGETILDLCAAPGGKTTFIAERMQNRGRIAAQDIQPERVALVRENCERLGVTCAEMLVVSNGAKNPANAFDRILVDAPCSNTGVMRRRVDLRWRIRPEEIERLRATQLDLLRQSTPLLKAGGTLVYSTCSLEPEENADVVKAFLSEHPQLELELQRDLIPFKDDVDGAFVAKIKKTRE